MNRTTNRTRRVLATTATLALLAGAPGAWADDDDDDEEIPFDVAQIYVELNDTDGDLGIHALIDGEPWRLLTIEDPNERVILFVLNRGRLQQQGLTELFFESAEPTFDELSPEEFFARFPEGEYEVEALTVDGAELESEVAFTHVLPAPPGGVTVADETVELPAAADCDAEPLPVVFGDDVLISWDPVTASHPEIGITDLQDIVVVGYQFVVELEREDEDPPLPTLVFSIDLPPDVTAAEVPEELLELGDELKFEILAIGETGNRTAVESCFALADW